MSEKAIINESIESLLDDINKLKEQGYYSIHIPSLKQSVQFAPLEIKHQKALLESGSDPDMGQFKFINTLNDVILDCLVDKATPILVVDRPLITLAIRNKCVSKTYEYVDDDNNVSSIDITDHLKGSKKVKIPERNKKFTITSGKIKISCSVPTLIQDKVFNIYIHNQRPPSLNNQQPPPVGDIFIGELAKYIDSIQVDKQVIDCRGKLTPVQVVTILEKLPMNITYMLTEKLQPIRDIETTLSTSEVGKVIPIDARLFT